MRTLTEAEARVIGLLLSSPAGNERERLRKINVARSTYHAARRRAYSEGWLKDRYVPDPPSFGYPRVTFALVRPHVDRIPEITSRWGSDPGNVLLWSSAQFVLGVFYHRSGGEAERFEPGALSGVASWALTIGADTSKLTVPVYFDFEGLWSNLSGISGTLAYPHGLGGRPPPETAASASPGWAATELVRRPFSAEAQGRPGHLMGPFGLAWSQQKLLRTGQVAHRVFLDPGRLPAYQDRQPQQYVFITGRLRESTLPERLFAVLTREVRVYPFLFVADSSTVLLGAVGGAGAGGAPAPTVERRPVMGTLQQMLEGIDVIQDQLGQVSVVVDHRYDRLVGATG